VLSPEIRQENKSRIGIEEEEESLLKFQQEQNVLLTVAHPGPVVAEARKSGTSSQSCHVHGVVSDWIFPGAETLYNMLTCFCRRRRPSLLLRHGKLSLLEFQL